MAEVVGHFTLGDVGKIECRELFAQHIDRLTAHAGGELRGQCPFCKPGRWTGNRRTGHWRCADCGARGEAADFLRRIRERTNTRPVAPLHEKRTPPLEATPVLKTRETAAEFQTRMMRETEERVRELQPRVEADAARKTASDDKFQSKDAVNDPLWPVLANAALSGLAGDIVTTIDPYTEADKVAVLLNVLTAFGNCINAGAHVAVQHSAHPARINVVFVGESSKGRKGTAWSTPRHLLSLCEGDWVAKCIKSGLSSAEGLIYNVRDEIRKKQPVREKGRVVDYEDVVVEEAADDRRLLVIEEEFASTLTVMNRDGNTLSAVIRKAWDDGNLSTLTRNSPLRATNAHVSIIGHITKQELLVRLDDTSKANGFANRFQWALVKRSKELPEGGAVPEGLLQPLAKRLGEVITFSRTVPEVKRDDEAKTLWAEVYHDLSEGKPGLLGAVLSRAEAQVLRLSLIYALLDKSTVIKIEHLKAALAVWEYCEMSAVLIFGTRLGDPTADRILEAIRTAGPQGMTDNDIYELFGRNKSANERTRALNLLLSLNLIKASKEETGGRPRTAYKAT